MSTTTHKFDRQGFLAIDPRAFLDSYSEMPKAPAFQMLGTVAIVDVCGPLDHHAGSWCDSYDSVVARVGEALASSAKSVVLRIDSPGGVVAGMLSAARSIRARARTAQKPLVAYVESKACSAGYCIASAADKIVCSDSALIGSIGVVNHRLDASVAQEKSGITMHVITSGARKADGNSSVPFTPEEAEALQEVTDSLAALFFDAVKENRGLDAKPLEAKLYVGAAAKTAGLVDSVNTFEGLLASLASGGIMDMSKYTDARAALEEAAQDDGDEGAKAKALLAKMNELDKPDGDGDDEPPASDAKIEEEEDDDKEAEASTSVGSTPAELAILVQKLSKENAALKGKATAMTRDSFLATRPDLSPELMAFLKTKPLAECQVIVKGIPKPVPAVKAKKGAEATVSGVRGETQVNDGLPGGLDAPRLPESEASALRERMGLGSTTRGTRIEGDRLILGVAVATTPVQAGK